VALPAFARRMPLHGVVDRERSGSENVRNVERCVEAETREGLDEADCTIHPQHQRELSSGLDEADCTIHPQHQRELSSGLDEADCTIHPQHQRELSSGLDEADCTIHPQHQREFSSGLDEQRDEAQAENSRSISPVRRAHSSGFAAVLWAHAETDRRTP